MSSLTNMIRAIDAKKTAPPGSESEFDTYIPIGTTSGGWAGKANTIATFVGGAYRFRTPLAGEMVWNTDEEHQMIYDGSAWFGIVAPLDIGYYGSHATAAGTDRNGFATTSSQNALTGPPAGHRWVFTQCDYTLTSDAAVGTYTVYPGVDRSGGFERVATAVTMSESTTSRGNQQGSIVTPLLTVDGDTTSDSVCGVGWDNDGTSPGALANTTHHVHLRGWVLKEY